MHALTRFALAAVCLTLASPAFAQIEQGPPKDKDYVPKDGYFEELEKQREGKRDVLKAMRKEGKDRDRVDAEAEQRRNAEKRRDTARVAVEDFTEKQDKAEYDRREKLRAQVSTYRARRIERDKEAKRVLESRRRELQIIE